MATKQSSAVMIISNGRSVLLGYHGEKEQWELPGGKNELNESSKECAIRECREETGLEPQISFFVGHVNLPKYTVMIWVCPVGDCLRVGSGEEKFEKWQWFAIDNLPDGLFEGSRECLKLAERTGVVRASQ